MRKWIISAFVFIIIVSCVVAAVDAGMGKTDNSRGESYTTLYSGKMRIDFCKEGIIKITCLKDYLNNVKIYLMHDYNECNIYKVKEPVKTLTLSAVYGNGKYFIQVVSDDSESDVVLAEATIEIENYSEKDVFTTSTYAVYYYDDMTVIKDAKRINRKCKDNFKRFTNIYQFVLDNMTYARDYNRDYAQWSYFPDIEEIYIRHGGVCVDYATMLASICRAQGLPCKVITGYAGSHDNLHTWVEVYIEGDTDFVFKGKEYKVNSWNRMDPTLDDEIEENKNIIRSPNEYEILSID